MATIQRFNRKLDKKGVEVQALKQQNESLEKRLENLEQMVQSLIAKD